MVIFSTCFKTDHFSQAGKERGREGEIEKGRTQERSRQREKEILKKRERKKNLAHTRYKASPDLCVCSSLCDADRLWLPLFVHSPTERSAPALMALTRCRTPKWIRPTVSLESQQQLNNTKTLLQSSLWAPKPFFTLRKQELEDLKKRGGSGEKERQQREEQKWNHMDVFKDHQGRETCAFSHKPW